MDEAGIIIVRGEAWRRMLYHASREYPKEACGLLLCPAGAPERIVQARPTCNATRENPLERYLVDPRELLKAEASADQRGMEISGVYHTHPGRPAVPSRYDGETAWAGYLYLILSIRGGCLLEVRGWVWVAEESRFEEVRLRMEPFRSDHENTPSLSSGA